LHAEARRLVRVASVKDPDRSTGVTDDVKLGGVRIGVELGLAAVAARLVRHQV